MPNEMIPFSEFVRRYLDTRAHDLEDWQLEIVRRWTDPTTRRVLFSMPRHQGRRHVERLIDALTRMYARAEASHADHLLVAVDPADPESHVTIRVREPAPENHRDHAHFIIDDLPDPGPASEAMRERMNDWFDRAMREDAERRERATIGILSAIDTSNVAESSDDELTLEQLQEAMREFRQRIRELYANTPFESPFRRMLQDQDQQVPDEITAEDRERWANELETTPMPDVGQDSGGALSSDELLEAIGEAVDEWKDVRDEA